MSRWFRVDDGLVDDPKVQQLPDALFRAVINLWCVTSQNGGKLPSVDQIAFKLRMGLHKTEKILDTLRRLNLIEDDDDGTRPHNWSKRQFINPKEPEPPEPSHKGKYIYFLGASKDGPIKIGISKNPWARVGELQTSHPDKLSLLATFKTRDTSEYDLHVLLAEYRRQGEWFNLPPFIMDAVAEAHEAKSDYIALLIILRSELRSTVRSSDVVAPRTETEQRQSRKDIAADAASTGNGKYEFDHGVIRLTPKDFAKWQRAYSHLDLAAELIAIEPWASQQANWFHAVPGALTKKNRELKARSDAARAGGPQLPLTRSGNPWPEGIV